MLLAMPVHDAVARLEAAADSRALAIRSSLAEDLRRLARDAGASERALAAATGLQRSYVHRVLAGEASPSTATYCRLAAVLGADLSVKLFPNTGAMVRDRFAAPMLEHLLAVRHPRWGSFTDRKS